MAGFYFRGLHKRDVRRPFAFGLGAWLLALLCEGTTPALIKGRAYGLMVVLEETLEFGGTLLLALSAVAAWSQRDALAGCISRPPFRPVGCCVGGGCCCAGRAVRRVGISSSAGRCTSNGRARGLLGQPGGWAVGRAGVPHAGCSARRTESSPGQSGP